MSNRKIAIVLGALVLLMGAATVDLATTSLMFVEAATCPTSASGQAILCAKTDHTMQLSINGGAPATFGSGPSGLTTNRLVKATSSTAIGNSVNSDDGTTTTFNDQFAWRVSGGGAGGSGTVALTWGTSDGPAYDYSILASGFTFSDSGLSAGLRATLRFKGDGTHSITFPAWVFAPALTQPVANNKYAVCELRSWGTTDANVTAVCTVQP